MSANLCIALAQINPKVGDIPGNLATIRRVRDAAAALGADLVVTPELSVTGYPPEDLVIKPSFLRAARAAVEELAAETGEGPGLIVGAPWSDQAQIEGPQRQRVTNAALLLDEGGIIACCDKHELPNYSVFDEVRVFKPGPLPGPVTFRGLRLGIPICEDIWVPDVCECLQETGAEILIVPNGSPFERDKSQLRQQIAVARVTETGLPLVFVNQVGGQDELVFDGNSFVLDASCRLRAHLPAFREELALTHWQRGEDERWQCASGMLIEPPSRAEEVYRALVLGLRDYVGKNGFPGVILGLSGGIDSALSAVLAADALGHDKVHCVMMPSPYTSRESLEDAAALAANLAVRLDEISISNAMATFDTLLADLFAGCPADTTEENIQARIRGLILMALSNKFGAMVLSTGNKSEMSVGYATLYGDMCGGFNVLKDIYKTTVFALARWRNENHCDDFQGPKGAVIPERIITRAPSAELRPDQRDEDSLPPYEDLDAILHGLIEEDSSVQSVAEQGFEESVVRRVWRMLDAAEYKRRQACPGVKVTSRAFGRDRRYPITNGFRP